MAYLELVIDGFNKALQENKDDIDAIQKLLEVNDAYLITQDLITDLFYRQANIQEMVLEVNYRLTAIPHTTISQREKYMKQEHAAELGEGLFYLVKLYATVTAMMTTYAARLHTKYNYGAAVSPTIDIKTVLKTDQYPNIILSFLLDQPRKDIILQVVFTEADISDFISDDTFIDKLKALDVRINVNTVYNQGSDRTPNSETINLSDFAKWLNSTLTPELIKGI